MTIRWALGMLGVGVALVPAVGLAAWPRHQHLSSLTTEGSAASIAVVAEAPIGGLSSSLDLNQASRAEIEAVGGIGVELAARILQARARGPFRDVDDLRQRVKGVSKRALQGLAVARMSVGGQPVLAP